MRWSLVGMQSSTTTNNLPKYLDVMAKGAQPIHYDKLTLGCEEKNLGSLLPPTKFFSRKASNIYTKQQQL